MEPDGETDRWTIRVKEQRVLIGHGCVCQSIAFSSFCYSSRSRSVLVTLCTVRTKYLTETTQGRQASFYPQFEDTAHHSRKVVWAEAKMAAVSQEEERRRLVIDSFLCIQPRI